jgi:hypothetical protein
MNRAASEKSRLGLVSFTAAAALAAAQLGTGCTDGVTPDCSDATVCAPNSGSGDGGEDGSVVLPEAGAKDGASAIGTDAEPADGG